MHQISFLTITCGGFQQEVTQLQRQTLLSPWILALKPQSLASHSLSTQTGEAPQSLTGIVAVIAVKFNLDGFFFFFGR
jgi:hypothetical protein